MKYAVVGLGAVGSFVGGLLAKSGENIVFIGKSNQVKILNEKGLKIKGYTRNEILIKNINASSDFSDLKDVDVIFICVKSQDTETLATELKNNLKESAIIISLQNGVRNSHTLENITKQKALSGVILFNTVYSDPGAVDVTVNGGLLIECPKSVNCEFVNALKNAGFRVKTTEKIQGYIYSKLIVNLQIAVTSLTGHTITESITDKSSREILVATMNEGIEILEKSGIKLETLPEINPIKIMQRMEKLNSFFIKIGSKFMGIKENARNSMWQSLSRRKPTEIDYINGEIIRIAKANGLSAPINSKLVELVKKAEKEKKIKKYTSLELKKILNLL